MANFAIRLKELRNEKKISQADLGNALNMGRTTIANYEQDIRFPDQNTLCKLANYFDVSLDYLLGRSTSRTNTHFNVFKKNHSIMLIIDPSTGEIIDFSSAALEFYGYKKDELLHKNINEINILPTDQLHKEMQNAREEKRRYFLFKHRLASGEIRDVEVYSGPINIEQHCYLYSIIHDITDRSHNEDRLYHIFEQVVSTLLNSKSPYKSNHEKRVTQLAVAIAKEMRLGPSQIERIQLASITHDIGKANLPSEILNKPDKLRNVEYELIKTHVQDSYDFLDQLNFKVSFTEIVLQHHERLDGSGYPQGLRDQQICLEARILAVADVVEAMISERPYRPAYPIEDVLEELLLDKGTKFDPEVVDTCVKLFRELQFSF